MSRFLLAVSVLVVAGAAAGTSAAARTELDNCKLITQAELVSIMRSPVQIRRGEGLTSCNFFWKGKRLLILSVGPAPLNGFHEFLRQAKSDRTAKVKTLSIGGNEAFEIDAGQPATGGYVRSIYGFHHGNQIQLTTGPNMSRTVLPSFGQLRQIVAMIVRRF